MTGNEDFSQAVENSQTISSAHDNSSSSGIEEYAKRQTTKSKSRLSVPKQTLSKSTTKTKNRSQQSTSKTGKKASQNKNNVTTFD